jgi:hypothetical protein
LFTRLARGAAIEYDDSFSPIVRRKLLQMRTNGCKPSESADVEYLQLQNV